MAITNSWHSSRPSEEVYHNNTLCTEGNNVEKHYRTEGTGNKRLCQHCYKLMMQNAYGGMGVSLSGLIGNPAIKKKD
jgi:hypothetical protein